MILGPGQYLIDYCDCCGGPAYSSSSSLRSSSSSRSSSQGFIRESSISSLSSFPSSSSFIVTLTPCLCDGDPGPIRWAFDTTDLLPSSDPVLDTGFNKDWGVTGPVSDPSAFCPDYDYIGAGWPNCHFNLTFSNGGPGNRVAVSINRNPDGSATWVLNLYKGTITWAFPETVGDCEPLTLVGQYICLDPHCLHPLAPGWTPLTFELYEENVTIGDYFTSWPSSIEVSRF